MSPRTKLKVGYHCHLAKAKALLLRHLQYHRMPLVGSRIRALSSNSAFSIIHMPTDSSSLPRAGMRRSTLLLLELDLTVPVSTYKNVANTARDALTAKIARSATSKNHENSPCQSIKASYDILTRTVAKADGRKRRSTFYSNVHLN